MVATLACPPSVIADMTSEQIPPVNSTGHADSSVTHMDQQSPQVVSSVTHSIDTSDPVTKAVVDNIVGNLPTKKPQV